jgi:hypothetical protein
VAEKSWLGLSLFVATAGCGSAEPGTVRHVGPAQPSPEPAAPAAAERSAPPSRPPQTATLAAADAPKTPHDPNTITPLGTISGDPRTLENIVTNALAAGAVVLAPLAGGEQKPLEDGIRLRADSQAPGMTPQGALMTARLSAGGHAATLVKLDAGACYTIVGFGGPGVLAYQINVLTAPPLPPQVLAQSAADAPHPTVGSGAHCLRHPYPLPMQVRIDLHVVQGRGLVAARTYKK